MNLGQYQRFKQMMRIRGLNFDWQRINVLREHNQHETDKHWMCKAMAVKALRSPGINHTIFTEFEFPNKAVADVYDATQNVVIEFESDFSKKKEFVKVLQFRKYVTDVFVFNVNDLPEHYSQVKKAILYRLGLLRV